jgi:hypothetical protein
MTNDCEPLMTIFPTTTEEKLLWERHHNQLLLKEVKELKTKLAEKEREYLTYKDSVLNTQNAQMLNKLIKLKNKYEGYDEKLNKLKLENEQLMCSLGRVNLKLKELTPTESTDNPIGFSQKLKNLFK